MKAIIVLLAIVAVIGFMPDCTPPAVEPVPIIRYIYTEAPMLKVTEVTERRYVQIPVQEYVWDDGGWDYAREYVPFTVEEAMDVFHSVRPGKWVIR